MTKIIPLREARNLKLRFYYTGKTCPRGHTAERFTSNRACSECSRSDSREWYSNPENYRSKNKRRWSVHKKEEKKRLREWRLANPEKYKQLTRSWRSRNSDRFKRKQQEWWSANKTKRRIYLNARRTRKKNNGGSHTETDINDILKMQRGLCAICRVDLDKYHVDHIIPLKHGGSNSRRNIQVLCPTCNQNKSHHDPIKFMRSLGYLL